MQQLALDRAMTAPCPWQ